jgi:hypothetical protein
LAAEGLNVKIRTSVIFPVVACFALAGCSAVPRGQRVHYSLVDYPATPGGYASGINPDSIRVVIGDRIVPREQLDLREITDPKEKYDPGSPAREFVLPFDPD